MNDVERLIEKLGLAIHGEEPAVVMTVLASFVQELCERYQVPTEDFILAIRDHQVAVKVLARLPKEN
jgi:hypothetical protein